MFGNTKRGKYIDGNGVKRMEFNQEFWVTLVFTFINIIVLYIILKKVLFKPVTKHMQDRTQKIQDALDMAEEAKRKVDEMKLEYDAKLRDAKVEGTKIVDDYQKMADKEYEISVRNAKKEADLIIQKAKAELEVEKEQLMSRMKKEMADLVLSASEKVLKQNIDSDANRRLISDFIDNNK